MGKEGVGTREGWQLCTVASPGKSKFVDMKVVVVVVAWCSGCGERAGRGRKTRAGQATGKILRYYFGDKPGPDGAGARRLYLKEEIRVGEEAEEEEDEEEQGYDDNGNGGAATVPIVLGILASRLSFSVLQF